MSLQLNFLHNSFKVSTKSEFILRDLFGLFSQLLSEVIAAQLIR